MITTLKQWLANRKRAQYRQDWRTGYLHAVDRRVFPTEPPLLLEYEAHKMYLSSAGFRRGALAGAALPLFGDGLDLGQRHSFDRGHL